MTANEILSLIYGVALGVIGMSALHGRWDAQDARRSRIAAQAARRRAAGDHYYSSFRLYQLQQRTGARR